MNRYVQTPADEYSDELYRKNHDITYIILRLCMI